jgi:hypothetical protein
MINPQITKRDRTSNEGGSCDEQSEQPSDYYYDDSTGYEIYQEDEAEEEKPAEDESS